MRPPISAIEPDWSRERIRRYWDPGAKLVRSIRRYQAAVARGGPLRKLREGWWVWQHRFWSVVSGADIPLNARLGGGLRLPHPNGVVIHPKAEIGPNCMIFQQVTVTGKVRIGGHVDIGAGAKLMGRIEVGDHARIGANSVVTRDVPPGRTAVGVPARLLPLRDGLPAAERPGYQAD